MLAALSAAGCPADPDCGPGFLSTGDRCVPSHADGGNHDGGIAAGAGGVPCGGCEGSLAQGDARGDCDAGRV